MKCDVIDLANKKKGSINLDEDIFGLDVRKDLLARLSSGFHVAKRAPTRQSAMR